MVRHTTPNQSPRPDGVRVDAIVLHADAGQSDAGTIAWIQNPAAKVSYHYLIGRDGTVHLFVAESMKAWHAGASVFRGRPNCNDYSIGVAFANNQLGEEFTPKQLAAGVELVADLCRTFGIRTERITTHAKVSPGRKRDPGPLFDTAGFVARVNARLAEAA